MKRKILGITPLGYLSSIILRLFENLKVSSDHPERFKLSVSFSKGMLNSDCAKEEEIRLSGSFKITEVDNFFKSVIGKIK
jgi:hypothetical protein